MRINQRRLLLACSLVCVCSIPDLRAQTIVSGGEMLARDRPEAWAMQRVASELQMTTMGVPEDVKPWNIEFGADFGWLPALDAKQSLIGFNGTKQENMNRAPAFVRPRVAIGLPERFSLDLSYLAPVPIGGIRPNFLAWSLGRPILTLSRWRLGARAHGQFGHLHGDITCDGETVRAGQDPIRNPYRCEAPSDDAMRTRAVGFELGSAFKISDRLELYIVPGWNYFANRFQVNALYSGGSDRSLLVTSDPTFSLTTGVASRISSKIRIAGEIFYTPLTVRRSGIQTRDSLLNLRVSVFYSIR